MKLVNIVQDILKYQEKRHRKMEADIVITNGNILLRAFHIVSFNKTANSLKGLTAQEEYAAAREDRDPVYCYLPLDEIKEINVPEMDVYYSSPHATANILH